MPEASDDLRIQDAFDEYRRGTLPLVDPPAFEPVLATAHSRRRIRAVGIAAAVVLAIGVPAIAVGGYGGPSSSPAGNGASPSAGASASMPSSPVPTPSGSSPSATTKPDRVAACAAGDLTAHVGRTGSLANQPFAVVVLTNTSGVPCTLRGYPQLTHVRGHGTGGPDGPMSVTVRNSSNYEYADPGPATVRLNPGRQASFALGTATAGGGPLSTITSLRLVIGGATLTVPVDLAIAAIPGHGLAISTTAYAGGSNAGT